MKAKKIWALVLVICMVFASAACGSSSRDDDDDDRSSRKTARIRKETMIRMKPGFCQAWPTWARMTAKR